jgi:hypothetical protein
MWGHDVLLVTRAPARPPLAESLPPSAAKLLDRIGVRAAVDGAGFLRSTGNTVRWGDAEERVEPFGHGALGHQVLRDRFDALLLQQARESGARVLDGVAGRVRSAPGEERSATVRCSTPRGPTSLVAPWILDCRGRSAGRGVSRHGRGGRDELAERAGHERTAPPGSAATSDTAEIPRTLALAGVWESARWPLSDPTHTLVESYRGGWAWSVPVSERRRYLTVMVDPAVTRLDGRALGTQYHEQLALTSWLGQMASASAHMVREPWACDATEYLSPEIVTDSVLRVGDAASFVDPLSSFGIKKALASAWLAAVVVHTSLCDSRLTGPATELYEARERAMYRALSRAAAVLAGPPVASHESLFWSARARDESGDEGSAGDDPSDTNGELDVAALRVDPAVQSALQTMRARDHLRFSDGPTVTLAPRPAVAGNRIELRDHLVSEAFPRGVRYLRGVDLVLLARLAPDHDQVGDLYGAYTRAAAPVPLPDFMGALATLVGKEVLVLA